MSHSSQRLAPVLLVLSSLSLGLITGCGATGSFSNPTASTKVSGRVFGGQQPIANSTVTVWPIGLTGYGSSAAVTGDYPNGYLAQTTTAADGTFNFPAGTYICPTPDTQVYIIAKGGEPSPGDINPNIALATGLGDCSTAQTAEVEINEVTTAVTAFALAQFFTTQIGPGSTDSFGTDPADLNGFTLSNTNTIPLLVNIADGTVNPNTAGSSGAPAITIDAAKIYSIANTLSSCVNDSPNATTGDFDNCGLLAASTYITPRGNPIDTLQAAVLMALYPWFNVNTLYQLAPKQSPFTGLSAAPYDWTIGVSYTTSTLGLGITSAYSGSPTSATIDIGKYGRIWFPSNLSGSTGLAFFDPVTATFSGPYLNDGSFIQPQYVAIDTIGNVWLTDEASGNFGYLNTNVITSATIESIPSPLLLGPIAADDLGDVFFTYGEGGTLGNIGLAVATATSGGAAPTTIQFAHPPSGLVTADGVFYASESGGTTPCYLDYAETTGGSSLEEVIAATSSTCSSGGVAFQKGGTSAVAAATSLSEACIGDYNLVSSTSSGNCAVLPPPFISALDFPEGVATDGAGAQWYANAAAGSVTQITPSLTGGDYIHDQENGNVLPMPYAIAIDGSGNVWVANAGCVAATVCTPTAFTLSEIIGVAAPTITPLSAQMGDGGYLVGSPPGTLLPVTAAGAHPSSLLKSAQSQNATWSRR